MTDPAPGRPPSDDDRATTAARKQASLRQVAAAVLWSFFGVRKGEAMQRDAVTIKPHQVIIVGILLAAVLVVALLIVVRVIMRNAA
jgi:preprotein translocase subunit Sec61beta